MEETGGKMCKGGDVKGFPEAEVMIRVLRMKNMKKRKGMKE